jgi:pyruvate dehydrogenase E2 component (dihydrolipoamide acetyltransferase)
MSENSPESRDFLVPDLGEGLEEASVVEWLVPVTGSVALNGPLCVLETAKATVEIPSPFAGRLVERGGEEGDTLTVGSLLARIQVEAAAPDANREHPSQASATRRTPTLVGYGADDEQDRSRRPGPVPTIAVSPPSAPPSGARPAPAHALAKPPVRRLARTLNVDLAALVPGSGRDGIVTRDDVLAAAPAIPTAAAIAAAPEPGSDQDADGAPAGDLAGKTVPVRGIRARIAERMTISRSRIPDATCSVTADCGALLDLRGRLNATAERAGAAPVITPFALIARLLVRALTIHPALNSTFLDDGPSIRLHGRVHLGVATATDHGLLVPVVRSAQAMSTLRLAQEIARLAETARAGTASPAELTGSTFTVSNFGALGLDEGIPVINYPEAAILGVGSIRSRAVVRNGEVVARPTATLTCAFDHRVADGAEAGAFLRELASWVEQPDLVLLHS